MLDYREAKSLIVLNAQINHAWPNRDHGADGWIGDATHRAEGSGSDHNPDAQGVVCALDVDRDLAPNHDSHYIALAIIASRDQRVKYIITDGGIYYGPGYSSYYEGGGDHPWERFVYHGSDQHTNHFHLSVRSDLKFADDTTPWQITNQDAPLPTLPVVVPPPQSKGVTQMLFQDASNKMGMLILPGGTAVLINDAADYQAIEKGGVPAATISSAEFQNILKACGGAR